MTDNSSHSERRRSARLKVQCHTELTADLSLLDAAQPEDPASKLVFFGETQDISAHGLSFVLPSIRIDEKYCEQSRPLRLSLQLPIAAIELEANAVRCVPLDENNLDQGYLIAARI